MRILVRLFLNGLAIIVAAWLIPGLQLAGPGSALIAGAILGVVNTLVRPLLLLMTLPFTLITLGLFIFVVNALCLGLHGKAPADVIASHATDGKVDRTRPLCPFPQLAQYKGSGSIDAAENFVCK